MRRYSLEYNPILQYYAQIKSKKVTVSKAIEKWYRYLVWHIQNPDEYFYSPKRANHIIEFAENFRKFSKGATEDSRFVWNFGKRHTWQQSLALLISMETGNAGNLFLSWARRMESHCLRLS